MENFIFNPKISYRIVKGDENYAPIIFRSIYRLPWYIKNKRIHYHHHKRMGRKFGTGDITSFLMDKRVKSNGSQIKDNIKWEEVSPTTWAYEVLIFLIVAIKCVWYY